MNRIYQGRISKVEALKPDTKGKDESDWLDLPNWEQAVWDHHELFQDAVNYYAIALLSLATDKDNPLYKIRCQLAEVDENGDPTARQVWKSFRRRGVDRTGMQDSVLKYICPHRNDPTLADCFADILSGNSTSPETLNNAVLQLLKACEGGGGQVRNAAVEFQPLFCDPHTKANFKQDKALVKRDWAQRTLPHIIHSEELDSNAGLLDSFDTLSIGTPDKGTPVLPRESAIHRIETLINNLQSQKQINEQDRDHYLILAKSLPQGFSLPGFVGSSVKGGKKLQLGALLIHTKLEKTDATVSLLRAVFSPPADNDIHPEVFDASKVPEDPVKESRVDRGYVFRAFTSLSCWNGGSANDVRWIKFDHAAFEEALKAINQIRDKTDERNKEKAELEKRLGYMENREKWKSKAEDDTDPPPILAGDPRIQRLEELLDTDLAQEYEATEGQSVAYGLQPRTIRGFRDLRKKWITTLATDQSFSQVSKDQLLKILHEFQKDNSQIMGSARLFEELLREDNWIIWLPPSEQDLEEWKKKASVTQKDAFYAEDPLSALTEKRLLERDIEKLGEPISFTPADPRYSRRQFYFSDVCNFSSKGDYNHTPNKPSVTVPLCIRTGAGWKSQRIRITYSAPRLLRDGLRNTNNENLKQAPFLQPMMEALGVPSLSQDLLKKHPVALMPEESSRGERRFLLNFPIELDTEALISSIGKEPSWRGQFAAYNKKNLYLYWPELTTGATPKEPEQQWWWKHRTSFKCMGVDLGQRDAGAFAVMDIGKDGFKDRFGKPKSTRVIGSTSANGEKSIWSANLSECGMIRLPGEDMKVLTAEGSRQEFFGEKGRMADESEWEEARSICEDLGYEPDIWVGTACKDYSFPEMNDKLLVVARRVQGRLARLQSLSWRLTDSKLSKEAIEEIKSNEDLSTLLDYSTGQNSEFLQKNCVLEIDKLKALLGSVLVKLADRILPLRGRCWEWASHPSSANSQILRQTDEGTDSRKKKLMGQRGLSMARIEQLEDLRRRAQALNRAQMHQPGEKPVFGRSGRGVELPDPCPEILEKLDRIKDQRINQTAHQILAVALGVRLKRPAKSKELRLEKDIHGEYEKFRDPVDFIVLEDLARYLSSQGRSRQENTRLMQWCHRAVLDKVKELAEPYGIPVLETNAAYSSRFCSKTGVVGFRAQEISLKDREKWPWRQTLENLSDPIAAKKMSTEKRKSASYIQETFEQLEEINKGRDGKTPKTLLIPRPGGPIFIPAKGQQMQADINAAANLCLRAIAQPDCHEILVKIRSQAKKGNFETRCDSKREKARWDKGKQIVPDTAANEESMRKSRNPNIFVDLAQLADYDQVKIDGVELPLVTGRGLWGTLKSKEWKIVSRINQERVDVATDNVL
jgi:IS605 OrfB family transposase